MVSVAASGSMQCAARSEYALYTTLALRPAGTCVQHGVHVAAVPMRTVACVRRAGAGGHGGRGGVLVCGGPHGHVPGVCGGPGLVL